LNRTVTTVGGQPLTYNKLDTLVGLGGPIAPDRAVQVAVAPELSPAMTNAAGTGNNVGVVHIGGWRLTSSFTDTGELLLDSVIDANGQAQVAATGSSVELRTSSFAATRQDVLGNPKSFSVARTSGIAAAVLADVTAPLATGIPIGSVPVIGGLTFARSNMTRVGSAIYLFGNYS